jgi:phosphatidate cytidylyltransferase
MLVVLLGALLAPGPWPLVALLTLIAACALWEWLRLTWPGASSGMPVVCAVVLACLLFFWAAYWLAHPLAGWPRALNHFAFRGLLPLAVAIWVIRGTAMVVRGRADIGGKSAWLSAFGVLAVAAAWVALVRLFLSYGAWFLVSLLALIWFADIAAYFTGKALGRHKLAPRVSPGKTWEGAAGGVVAATLWVAVSSAWDGSFGAVLKAHWSWAGLVAAAVVLACLSIMGDLFESLLKRRAGVKDSSGLLPGHGGVYDRIDALLPVAPVACLLVMGLR